MSKIWIYGNWNNLGWGSVYADEHSGELLDFVPEFEFKADIGRFWAIRKNLIKVMGLLKFSKCLVLGLRLYYRLIR